MVERPRREREVVGSILGRAIPKALKMVTVTTLLGAQHYKASTGSSLTQVRYCHFGVSPVNYSDSDSHY